MAPWNSLHVGGAGFQPMFHFTRQRCGRAAGFCFVHVSQEGDGPMLKIKEFIELWLMGQQIKKAFAEAAKAQPQKVEFAPCGYCGADDPYRQSLECHHCGGN